MSGYQNGWLCLIGLAYKMKFSDTVPNNIGQCLIDSGFRICRMTDSVDISVENLLKAIVIEK